MLPYIASRVALAATTLVLAISLAVVLTSFGGDPVENLLGPFAPRDQVQAERERLGLDRPLLEQVMSALGNAAQGDLGTSLRYDRPTLSIILDRFPASLQLMLGALLVGIVVGVPFGILAALRENSLTDRIVMSLALVGHSVPLYWLGLVAVLLFAVKLEWLPAGQMGGWQHLVLPVLVLATLPLGRIARITRSSMSQVLGEDYILAARARGLTSKRIVVVHALRNAALPVVTMIGLLAGSLLSGAVTVEVVFAWPGLGSLAIDAVSFRDFTLVQGIVMFGAIVFVVINFAVDMLYGLLDPRIRSHLF